MTSSHQLVPAMTGILRWSDQAAKHVVTEWLA
jgi:hypothetical protein